MDEYILVEKARKALKLTVSDYDDELLDLVLAAKTDLGIAGVIPPDQDPLITRAVITYVKVHFLTLADGEFDRLKASYDEQKAQLATATGFTDWGNVK